jgi:hypothetical protein
MCVEVGRTWRSSDLLRRRVVRVRVRLVHHRSYAKFTRLFAAIVEDTLGLALVAQSPLGGIGNVPSPRHLLFPLARLNLDRIHSNAAPSCHHSCPAYVVADRVVDPARRDSIITPHLGKLQLLPNHNASYCGDVVHRF